MTPLSLVTLLGWNWLASLKSRTNYIYQHCLQALKNVTTLTSQDISIAEYVAELTMTTQILLSLILPTTTVKEFVEIPQIQTLLSGLPEEIDSPKTQMWETPTLTIGEINTRVLNEEAAIRAISTKVSLWSASPTCWRQRSSDQSNMQELWLYSSIYLKNVGSSFQNLKTNFNPRSEIPTVTRVWKLPMPASMETKRWTTSTLCD